MKASYNYNAKGDAEGCKMAIGHVVSVVVVLVIIQYSALVVRSGYTGNVVVLRVACKKW